jgi:hypothetical protein
MYDDSTFDGYDLYERPEIEAALERWDIALSVQREYGYSIDEAYAWVVRLEPITGPPMARHGLTKKEAIIALLGAM